MADEKELGREKLKRALERCESEYLYDYPAEEQSLSPSIEYSCNLRKLNCRIKAPFFSRFPTVGKRIAAAAVALMVFMGGIGTISVSAGNPDAEIYFTSEGDGVKFTFLHGSSNVRSENSVQVYSFSSVPEGYVFHDRVTMSRGFSIQTIWKKGENVIVLYQDDLGISMHYKDAEVTTHERNGKKIVAVTDRNRTEYIWTNADAAFTLFTTEKMTNEEVFALVETLAKLEEVP